VKKALLSFAAVCVCFLAVGCGEKKQEVKITAPGGQELKVEVKK
jgi:hypothetical protein